MLWYYFHLGPPPISSVNMTVRDQKYAFSRITQRRHFVGNLVVEHKQTERNDLVVWRTAAFLFCWARCAHCSQCAAFSCRSRSMPPGSAQQGRRQIGVGADIRHSVAQAVLLRHPLQHCPTLDHSQSRCLCRRRSLWYRRHWLHARAALPVLKSAGGLCSGPVLTGESSWRKASRLPPPVDCSHTHPRSACRSRYIYTMPVTEALPCTRHRSESPSRRSSLPLSLKQAARERSLKAQHVGLPPPSGPLGDACFLELVRPHTVPATSPFSA